MPTTAPATAPTTLPSPSAGTTSPPAVVPSASVVAGGASPTSVPATTAAVVATVRPPTAAASAAPTTGKLPEPAPGAGDAYEKDPSVFRVGGPLPGRGGKVSMISSTDKSPITPRDQNPYWQELERRLGVSLDPTFVPSSSYDEKFAALVASGDIPDFVFLTPTANQAAAIQQGAFADITAYVTGDALKEYPNLAGFPATLWKNIAINGKIYGVPRPRALAGDPLAIRQDWLEKLGLAPPTNADTFFGAMLAFAKNDPDGNGKADSYGLSSQNGSFSLAAIENMFRVPNTWRKNADGTFTAAIETEEFTQSLAFARRLFEAGGYHPDAPTMTTAQARDAFVSGKVGGITSGIAGLPLNTGLIQRVAKTSPGAKVLSLIPPGHDGGKGTAYNGPGTLGFTALSAKAGRDRERVKELLRILDYYVSPVGSEEWYFLRLGLPDRHYTLAPDGSRVATDLLQQEKHDLNLLTGVPFIWYYPGEPGIPTYLQKVSQEMLAIGVDNPTLGLFSRTNAMRGPELERLRIDRISAMITGREPLSVLEQYRRDWRSRGGDQIRKEYQDALKGV